MRETPDYTYCCDHCGMDHPSSAHNSASNFMPCYICGDGTYYLYDECGADFTPTCGRAECNAQMALLVAESQLDDTQRPVAQYEPPESFYAGLRAVGY